MVRSSDLQLGAEIAEGQFAVVVRALLFGQRVAVKQLKASDDTDGAKKVLAELKYEMGIMTSLHHPRIVTCIGATDDPTVPWLVLEFLEHTLYEVCEHGA